MPSANISMACCRTGSLPTKRAAVSNAGLTSRRKVLLPKEQAKRTRRFSATYGSPRRAVDATDTNLGVHNVSNLAAIGSQSAVLPELRSDHFKPRADMSALRRADRLQTARCQSEEPPCRAAVVLVPGDIRGSPVLCRQDRHRSPPDIYTRRLGHLDIY